jgi:cell division protein FtsW
MIIISKINIDKIFKKVHIIFFISLALLILVLIPGIGVVRGGARSWIGFGSFSIQPAEIVKLTLIIFLSVILTKIDFRLNKLMYVLIVLGIIIGVFFLIMLQPDFGTGLVIVLSSIIVLFCSGLSYKYFIILGAIGIIGIAYLIISAPYRLERIFAFLNPWNDPLGSGFQAIQSLFSIAPSGIFGLGYNNSMQKHFFLPEPQNDFIFAIICEELGLIGGLVLIASFAFLIIRLIILSTKLENKTYKLTIIGIASSIFVQVFINLGVVIGIMPVTGITLPIISYGGSSLIFTLIMIGLAINISRFRED